LGGLIPLSDASRRPVRLPVVTAFIIALNVGTFGTRPGRVSCYLLSFLLPDEPSSEVQANLKRLSKQVLPSMAACLSPQIQTAVRRITQGLAWSGSTLLHQRGSALSDLLELHFKATKFLRA
jgi:hypothetical protein